jgi:hypothetical protein
LRATLANGNAYDNDYCFVLELENGLIRARVYGHRQGQPHGVRRRLTGPER